MKRFPILYWPNKTRNDADYQLARRVINARTGIMPDVISGELDVPDVISKNPGSLLYYPIFCESTGWWGELLGGDARVMEKLIISPECQLMVIGAPENMEPVGPNQLLAAEIYPASGFFKKMNSSVAVVSDMLATDSGTILALFSGTDRGHFINILESTGNSYLGCVGQY